MNVADVRVISQKKIARNIFELRVGGEVVKDMTSPGQFVHLKVGNDVDTLLRRPLSIGDADTDSGMLTMIYRVEGKGTERISRKKEGDTINLLGPLGNGFPTDRLEQGETALLVGGGIGVPPMYYLSKQLIQRGVTVKHVLGFASKADAFYEQQFSELGETYVTTVDGTHGVKGFVTDAIDQHELSFDALYACGPVPMLKALEQQYHHREAYFSLEQRMGCGIGACLACVCPLQGDESGTQYVKVCSDGPVFPVGEVVL